jgi:hypothetical protein
MVGGLTRASASLWPILVETYRARAGADGSIAAMSRTDLSAFGRLRQPWVVKAFPDLIVTRP